ncbi:sigma factor [Sanguibacter gelidistatuariae]|nr:sigma factor [Sanguibacter gelidistatuariae]
MDSARIVGALARYTGDFSLAEDLAQEALAEALVSWSVDGAPAQPTGWLLTTGRRRAIDAFRRRSARDERYALLARDLDEELPGVDALFDPDAIDDDVLALMFISCHPVLSKEARIARRRTRSPRAKGQRRQPTVGAPPLNPLRAMFRKGNVRNVTHES